MHTDRVGDVAQNQRPQRLHAATKKSVLLTHNFCGNFEDGGGSLVQGFDQPIRCMEPLGQVVFLGFATGCLAYPSEIASVDEDAGQRIGIKFDKPTAALGLSAPVAIDVAIAFAVSWNPFVKSNASPAPTTRMRMMSGPIGPALHLGRRT